MALPQADRALCTDLYELTMAAAYFELGMSQRAAFELTVRSLPPGRSYLVCAGLEQAVSYLQNLRFTGEQIGYVRALPMLAGISGEFFDYLREFRFTGSLSAMPEGTPAFADEPLLRVEAPIIQAQVVETFLLSMVNYQTLVATKASRVVQAARTDGRDRPVVDFGTRRAHGPDAAVLAARAAYIGGCAGTSNVEAGHRLGIPVSGTEAHSFIMAFASEEAAFSGYYRCFGGEAVLLVDTYDVLQGVRRAIRAAPGMHGIRIDSGDIANLSRRARAMLDDAGLRDVLITASGDLDEFRIAELLTSGARVDGFGVGTKLVTSDDAPFLGGVYKLVAVQKNGRWEPCLKLSPEKQTFPGMKAVFRFSDPRSGQFTHDLLAGADEPCPEGAASLLKPVLGEGKPSAHLPALDCIRAHAAEQLARLPDRHRRLKDPEPYPVEVSRPLREAFASLSEHIQRGRR
jgi:nicotinate phosphoribosyltransferase